MKIQIYNLVKKKIQTIDAKPCLLMLPMWSHTYKFATHRKMENSKPVGRMFCVTELSTGAVVAYGKTRKSAIEEAQSKLCENGTTDFQAACYRALRNNRRTLNQHLL
jgi:hypothetical protein